MTDIKLNRRQQNQIDLQIREHQKYSRKYKLDPLIRLAPGVVLDNFVMHPHVFQPLSSRFLACHLFQNPALSQGKNVIDIGTGSGVLGLVCGIQGAKSVTLSDISPLAFKNTRENIKIHKMVGRCQVVQGDLFENVKMDADLITFAQPYFPGNPMKDIPVTMGMLADAELIHRFFEQAKPYLKGAILMPYLEWVGPINNPGVQAPKHGFNVRVVYEKLINGIQKGKFRIYEMTL